MLKVEKGDKKMETRGRVAHATVYGHRVRLYAKPSLGKDILRKAGVNRTSEKVLARNKWFATVKPAKACKGLKFSDGSFQRCLREQLLGKLKTVV
jgi:hypothetical protein